MPAASTCAQINQLQVLIQRGEIREICFVRWRRPVLVVVDEAGVVVVPAWKALESGLAASAAMSAIHNARKLWSWHWRPLHKTSAKTVRAVDESLGAQRWRRRVVH